MWRQEQLNLIRSDPNMLLGAKEYYAEHPVEFILHWCDTYDPRNAGSGIPARLPFVLFERQAELVEFLLACIEGKADGLLEKSRDMGATWVACAVSVWLWLFWEGAAIGWGSRKEQLVDKLGDLDSIFEKIRMLIRGLPNEFLPKGFSEKDHMLYMRVLNPENDSTITGEAGNNIGRGGRKLVYFKDESAHYEQPESIEAALGDNTNVQIDISSVNGIGNVFYRRRHAGIEWVPKTKVDNSTTNVFIMDWEQHPAKTKEWYDKRRKKAEADGLLHLFAQEVDRDYSASVDGVVIKRIWIQAAIDAHIKLGLPIDGPTVAGLDVADEGGDKNAIAVARSLLLMYIDNWAEGTTGETTAKVIEDLEGLGEVSIQYDSIGVGAGVKSEAKRLSDAKLLPKQLSFTPWAASAKPLHPNQHIDPDDEETPKNKDFYFNLKAQAWWQLRRRFEKTYRAVEEGIPYPADELISLPKGLPNLAQLEKELGQVTASRTTGTSKLIIDKKPPGTKSPNLADAVVMAFWPIPADAGFNWYVSGDPE